MCRFPVVLRTYVYTWRALCTACAGLGGGLAQIVDVMGFHPTSRPQELEHWLLLTRFVPIEVPPPVGTRIPMPLSITSTILLLQVLPYIRAWLVLASRGPLGDSERREGEREEESGRERGRERERESEREKVSELEGESGRERVCVCARASTRL